MMKTLVYFRAGNGNYAVPVESTLGVRMASGMVALPAPRPDVVGVLPGEPPIIVVSPLGAGAEQVLVLQSEGVSYGLLVEQVTGLGRVDEGEIRPAPTGQELALVSGVVGDEGDLVLLADPVAMAKRL